MWTGTSSWTLQNIDVDRGRPASNWDVLLCENMFYFLYIVNVNVNVFLILITQVWDVLHPTGTSSCILGNILSKKDRKNLARNGPIYVDIRCLAIWEQTYFRQFFNVFVKASTILNYFINHTHLRGWIPLQYVCDMEIIIYIGSLASEILFDKMIERGALLVDIFWFVPQWVTIACD